MWLWLLFLKKVNAQDAVFVLAFCLGVSLERLVVNILVKCNDLGCGAKIELSEPTLVGVLEGLVTCGLYSFGNLLLGGVEATGLERSVCLADVDRKIVDVFVKRSVLLGDLASGDLS